MNIQTERPQRVVALVAVLLAGGLLGHLVAAYLNGGSSIAYTHHILGFFFIAAVTGLPIAGVTWLFWRKQRNRALIILALIQLVLGVMVAMSEWRKTSPDRSSSELSKRSDV